MSAQNESGAERESVWGAMEAGADDAIALSAAGVARRERMMGEVSRAAGARRARRVMGRGVGVIALAGVVTAGIWMAMPRGAGSPGGRGEVVKTERGVGREAGREVVERPVGHEDLTAAGRGTSPVEATREGGGAASGDRRVVRVEIVASDPGIMARYAAGPTGRVASIDDDELIRLMNQMGKPTGIVRTAGKVMLTAEMEKKEGEPVSVGRDVNAAERG